MPSYVIIGASRGLGYEWLRQLSQNPVNTVIGLARTPGPVELKLIADKINTVHIMQADMADHISLKNAAKQVEKLTGGSLDYLIVNGVYSNPELNFRSPSTFMGDEDYLRKDMIASLDVSVLGTIHSINAFLPLLRKSSIKKVIAMTTGLADIEVAPETGIPYFVTYTAMKAALNMIIVRYSIELKDEGIIFLALSPGVVQTQETPPTDQEMANFLPFLAKVKEWKPHWKGPVMPADSIKSQKDVIEKITIKDSGSFLSHLGNKMWI